MAFEVARGRQDSGHLFPNTNTFKVAGKPWQTLTCKRQLPPNLCRTVCLVSLSWFLSAHKTQRPKIHPPYHQQGHEARHSNCPLNALPVSAALAIRSFFPVEFSSLTVSTGEVSIEKLSHKLSGHYPRELPPHILNGLPAPVCATLHPMLTLQWKTSAFFPSFQGSCSDPNILWVSSLLPLSVPARSS